MKPEGGEAAAPSAISIFHPYRFFGVPRVIVCKALVRKALRRTPLLNTFFRRCEGVRGRERPRPRRRLSLPGMMTYAGCCRPAS